MLTRRGLLRATALSVSGFAGVIPAPARQDSVEKAEPRLSDVLAP
jgi:hypothetical protein